MAIFYMIRHGEADYSYGDRNSFIGHGHDLAPLKSERLIDVIETSKDERLKKATVIVSSPYTRALQTAAIISKQIGIDIVVEPDIREWEPDITYQYRNVDEMRELHDDYIANIGEYPLNQIKKWESKESLKNRANLVIEKYKSYDCVIIVAHKMIIQSICGDIDLKPAQIVEYKI